MTSAIGTDAMVVILSEDSIFVFTTALLRLLRIDPIERFLYKVTALFLFRCMLTDLDRLAPSSFQDGLPILRRLDTNRVSLSSLLHQITL